MSYCEVLKLNLCSFIMSPMQKEKKCKSFSLVLLDGIMVRRVISLADDKNCGVAVPWVS